MSDCDFVTVWRGDSWRSDEPVIEPQRATRWRDPMQAALTMDAQVLAWLARTPGTVRDLQQQLSCSYSKAYGALRRLERQGRVTSVRPPIDGFGRPPARYRAVANGRHQL